MRRSSLLVTLGLAVALLGPIGATPASAAIGADPVATGLSNAAAFTFAPDGRIFYGERLTGQIRIYDPDTDSDTLFFDIPNLLTDGERGLLGIALHPNYPSVRSVFAYAVRTVGGQARNQIVRLTDQDGTGTGLRVIFSSGTASGYHVGGRILFGPGGFLYAVVGDGHNAGNAQNTSVVAGKVLRMTAGGLKAPNNPFGNRVWAYGIRNSYGFAFDPQNGRLWESENGPACNDELNRIVRGGNFAWGSHQTCNGSAPGNTNQDGSNRIMPKRWWVSTIAPTGMAFCDGCGLGSGNGGKLFMGAFNDGRIRRFALGPSRFGISGTVVVYSHGGAIYSMETGPDGGIFFSDGGTIYRLVTA
jgi:glucose/arabinose dehydrogenase